MHFSSLTILSALSTLTAAQFSVPVPWQIDGLALANTRHGTGGYWQFNITDSPTSCPQGFESVSCYYYGQTSYDFALDGYPVDVPCNEDFTELTFTFAPNGNKGFDLNITHVWGDGGLDNGTWTFSYDDVRGQEVDLGNNFGQAGGFATYGFDIYPLRSTDSFMDFD